MTDKAEDVKALIAQIAEPRARTDIAEALAEAIDESEIDYTEMSRFVVAQAAEIAALREQLARSCDDERADPEGLACPIGANLNLAERRITAQAAEIDRLRESLPVPRNEYWAQGE